MVTNKKRAEEIKERISLVKDWPKKFKNIPKVEFCMKAKISRVALYNILKGSTIPKLETIERLETCLKQQYNK